MKALTAKVSRGLPIGAIVTCADNSGAKELQIISVRGFKSHRKLVPSAGVACLVTCRVYRGVEKVRHEMMKAVIVRQRRPWKRANGMWISFEDNAAVVVDDKFDPKGTFIKGPIAKEVVERFSTIGKLASMVV